MNKLLRKASNILKDKGTPLARDPNTRSDTSPNRSIPHNPSHNNPDADDTLECASVPYENILPQNILAFRTITTLLAKIQQDRPAVYSNALDRTDLTDSRRRELKISNALANLAIVDTDIVALVSKLTNFSDGLEVVVCGNPDGDNDQTAKPSESPPSIWDILFARNSPNLIGPLRPTDSTARQARAPTIVAAVKPAGLKSDDAKEISRYIDEDW
jgi:hypothetical protein